MSTISIKGLNKADVLAALYNASKPQGMGFMQYDPKPMTRETAEEYLKSTTYFDYLKGRVMKINLEGNEFDSWAYNRDNGANTAENVIAVLRSKQDVNSEEIQKTHEDGTIKSAGDVRNQFGTHTSVKGNTMTLGLDGVEPVLAPMVEKALVGKGARNN